MNRMKALKWLGIESLVCFFVQAGTISSLYTLEYAIGTDLFPQADGG